MYIKTIAQSIKNPKIIRKLLYTQFLVKNRQYYHDLPFINLYKNVTGEAVSACMAAELQKKYPKIKNLSQEQIQNTLQILSKFGINAQDACLNPHIFCMNIISMDNYGEILRECNFTVLLSEHIIRYHTLVKSRTIKQLKQTGLLKDTLNLEELLHSYFHDWPDQYINLLNFPDSNTNILTIRMSVLERYLQWKFSISSEEFKKYCKNYLPLKHRPMCDIQEAINIAQNDIKFDKDSIRRNGFIISSDPMNTKLILENVNELGGLDIRDAIKIEPAILKNHYQALLNIKSILERYNISNEAQRNCLKVYCMRPETVLARMDHLVKLKEYQVLSSNPRVLFLVIHEKKMMARLSKIQVARKQCFSLNHLVASSKVFNTYINSFGNKTCGRDMAILISSSLQMKGMSNKLVLNELKRHKYWLYIALNVIGENLQLLKKEFSDDVIFQNCQLLLYPGYELEEYIEILLKYREDITISDKSKGLDTVYRNLDFKTLTDSQILSLVLYEIEKKYHFSGDGVWDKSDGKSIRSHSNKQSFVN